jgi:ABC-type sugar transport system ATPase subunit
LNGQQVRIDSPRDALSRGIAYLAEDRHREGMISCLSIVKNLTLPILKRFAPRGVLHLGQENRFVDEMIRKVAVLTRGRHQVVASLSGGNQQKVLIARWLMKEDPKVLFVDEPTRGIDEGARVEIYALLDELACKGLALVVMSSEFSEILGLCDRVYVLKAGRIAGEFHREEATQEALLARAI